MTDVSNQSRRNFILLGSCFLLAILFDVLFYDQVIGISYPIFWLVFYSLFYFIFREKLIFEKRFEWFLMIPILLLILTFILFSSVEFLALNSVVVPILFIAQSLLLTKNNKHPWYKVSYIGEAIAKVITSIVNVVVPFKLISQLFKTSSKKTAYSVIGKVVIGLILSLPLLVVILVLLTSADSIFNSWVNKLPNWFEEIDLGNFPDHLSNILFVFFAIFIYLWSLLHPRQQEEIPSLETEQKSIWIDGIISLTILVVIDFVYVLFTMIQVSYLFGGAKLLLPKGVTYAEYAHEGFYQLVTVTVLNIIILLIFIHGVKKTHTMIYRTIQILLSLLTVCTGFILLSAFQRLSLYEEVYGYTYTRVLVHAFMILLLALFIVALIKTWKNDISLMKHYTIILLIWYVVLNYINIDQFIAEKNVERYYKMKVKVSSQQIHYNSGDRYGGMSYLDVLYLNKLSYDVVPQLLKLRKEDNLKANIDNRLLQMKHQLERENTWQSFNLSKHKARQLLKEIK